MAFVFSSQVPRQNETTAEPPIGTVYMTIEGLQATNDFVLMIAEGDVTEPGPKTTVAGRGSIGITVSLYMILLSFSAQFISRNLY